MAIVTGAARGIGRAIAERLAEAGYDVAAADLAPGEDGQHIRAFACDIADIGGHAAFIDAVVGACGRIDLLVNNAGRGAVVRGDLLDLAPENLDTVLGVNLRGTIFLTHAVARWMLAHPAPGRSIVNITSVSAEAASPDRIDYCVSKAGLAMWSRGLAVRLAPEGIAVFDVRPGIIRTDMTAGAAAKYDALIDAGLVPAGRWGEADDVARAVAALASGSFAFSTGSVVAVDGGLSLPRF